MTDTPERRHFAPATARNRAPILEVLRRVLPAEGLVLEIASGTGEHAAHFAAALPGLTWQPTEPETALHPSIVAHAEAAGLGNVRSPEALDATWRNWGVAPGSLAGVFCANMIHISPWNVAEGLVAGAGRHLAPGAPLVLYGPFLRDGVETALTNLAFDRTLRAQDPSWGIRDLAEVETLAEAAGLALDEVVEMPSNNLTVVFRKLS